MYIISIFSPFYPEVFVTLTSPILHLSPLPSFAQQAALSSYDAPPSSVPPQTDLWNEVSAPPALTIPKIIYSSRTHSQLSQAVKEGLATAYEPKICVLGSRDQLCLKEEVRKLESNLAKTNVCRQKVAARQCEFHFNLEARQKERDASGVNFSALDIEVQMT